MSILGDIGLSEQLVLSYIVGIAGAPAVHPFVQSLVNDAWRAHPTLPPNAIVLAEGVAQGQVDPAQAQEWAQEQGIGAAAFKALVNIANVGMPLGSALQSYRRGDLTKGQFETQLNRAGIEQQWFPMMDALAHDRLELGALATAVHRGIMSDAGLLVTPVPSGPGNIPRIPVSPLDTLAEFAAQGIDPERARVLVADTGLPLSLGEMLQLYNRGQVTKTDVQVSIAESNVRNEYMDVALDLARHLLTPHEYAEAELRGVMSPADAKNGAGLSGLNGNDYDTLFAILGRPLNVHQVTTGLARGGTYGGDYTAVPEGPYRDAIRRSAIRPEYADLDYHNRYTYPSAFAIRGEAPELGQAATEQILLEMGWSPHWAQVFSTKWAGATTPATADPHVAKAQTQLWTTIHTLHKKGEITDAQATAALPTAGVDAAAIPQIIQIWGVEHALVNGTFTG